MDDDVLEAIGGLGREQQVVDADAGIAAPGAGLEVPEGECFLVVDGAQRVGQAKVEQGAPAGELSGR